MLAERRIDIARDFTPYPVGRDEQDSANANGREFRRNHLVPAIEKALKEHVKVVVVLEGLESVGSSFLEEAFGGLVRCEGFGAEQLKKILQFDYDWPGYKTPERRIWSHIANARPEGR